MSINVCRFKAYWQQITWSFYRMLECLLISSCVLTSALSLLLTRLHILGEPQLECAGGCLCPHLSACLFVHSLYSAAELTRCHFTQATGMVQLKGVIIQNALMMAEMPELQQFPQGKREGERKRNCHSPLHVFPSANSLYLPADLS